MLVLFMYTEVLDTVAFAVVALIVPQTVVPDSQMVTTVLPVPPPVKVSVEAFKITPAAAELVLLEIV